jgi:Raf kinase inhibitor-like YbhB/YbcL family protein
VRRGAGRGRGRSIAASLAVLAVAVPLGGCGLLGKPQPLSADAPLTMSVTSPYFTGDIIPATFTCKGALSSSPSIFWSGAPSGTKSIALVVDDAAAPISPRVYWIVYDINSSTTDLPLGVAPPHARVAQNSIGEAGYDPPCPVGAPHSYRFTVYALNTFFNSSLPPNSPLLAAWTTIAQHVIARGTFTARALPSSGPAPSTSPSSSVGPANDAAGLPGRSAIAGSSLSSGIAHAYAPRMRVHESLMPQTSGPVK